MTENLDRLPACFKVPQLSLHPMHEFSLSSTENQPSASTRHLIFFCSVRSPSLTNMADSSRRVELADLDWLFFIPSNQRTNSLMACTWWERREYLKNWTRSLQSVFIIKMMWSINFLILHFNGRRDWESEAGGGCLRCILYLLLPRPQVRLPHPWSRASHSCFRPTGDIFKKARQTSFQIYIHFFKTLVSVLYTRSFMRRSFTMKFATMDFIGDANWSGASMAMWPRDTRGVMSCSGTSAFRLRDRGWEQRQIRYIYKYRYKYICKKKTPATTRNVYSAC